MIFNAGIDGGTGRPVSGVLPAEMIADFIKAEWIHLDEADLADDVAVCIPDENVQPASLDLRLGKVAYRLRCSFLPDDRPVEQVRSLYQMGEVSLEGDGGILELNRPYLVPLVEQLRLPENVRGKANPKSSTGRLDVFTRVITDRSFMFDEIPAGYHGRLYLEVVPRTFTIRARAGQTLNQLRLMVGRATLSDEEIRGLHEVTPLLYKKGTPIPPAKIATSNGLFLSLHLAKGMNLGSDKMNRPLVGFRAKEHSGFIDLVEIDYYPPEGFWEAVYSEPGDRIVLHPEKFYLLLSQESVAIPSTHAAEMTAYDPTSGELRTHYAGFFDPGFGCGSDPELTRGSRAALEVRAHDVPFAVEHGQNICKLSFERMLQPPEIPYGHMRRSNYQGQEIALGKHFRRPYVREENAQLHLFDELY